MEKRKRNGNYLFYFMSVCPEKPAFLMKQVQKQPMKLAVIINSHHRKPHGGPNSGTFDPKSNALNHSVNRSIKIPEY